MVSCCLALFVDSPPPPGVHEEVVSRSDLEMFAESWTRHLVFIGTPAHGTGDALFLKHRWRVFNF